MPVLEQEPRCANLNQVLALLRVRLPPGMSPITLGYYAWYNNEIRERTSGHTYILP
jgi:hypothetical protein